ncbi:MAG: inositol monophosphatase family protein [Myxococcota bacterium]
MSRAGATVEDRVAEARRLAEEAGRVLMGFFGRLEDVQRKGVVDLVTEADETAEDLIRRGVRDAFPQDAFVGEESGAGGNAEGAWSWIVDPLDGTTNFVHGLPRFAVSIGLARGGDLAGGVIHDPARRETFHAVAGGGAWLGDRRMRVADTERLGDALVVTGFPYDRREHAAELIGPVQRAMEQARGVRRMGAAAMDLVDVARGVFAGFWEPRLAPWDMAAGVVLVREAGGTVTAYGGEPFDLHGDSLVASNGRIHDALVAMVGRA